MGAKGTPEKAKGASEKSELRFGRCHLERSGSGQGPVPRVEACARREGGRHDARRVGSWFTPDGVVSS